MIQVHLIDLQSCVSLSCCFSVQGLWVGIMHHVCNIHSRATGSCQHGHLEEGEGRHWIQRDSSAHKALVGIILNKRWQGNVHKYLHFR